ncbi:MAG: metalloprotease PmbA [Methylococcaceae bacterium]|nr:MAG: metalloprotease PmbA [Methylococcaceae bacterium]
MNHKTDVAAEQARLLGLVEDLLRVAKAQGASGAEAAISVDRGLSVTARLGRVETIEHHCNQGLGLTVYIGQRKGSASSTDLSPQSIRDTVAAACRIARYATEDPYAGLPDADRLATEFPDLDLYHPWELDADVALALAIQCEAAGRQLSPEITNSEGATVSTHQGVQVLGNSLGFLHGYAGSHHSLSCALLGQRGEDMQRDYWYSVARDAAALEPAAQVGRKAAERTMKRLGGRSLSSRQCPVLFSAEIAAGLLGHFIGAIRGGNLYRKSSFLLDCLGKQVFPAFVHIEEQPHWRGALGSASYDSEGVATRPHALVRDGVLQSYVLSSYSARKLGLQTTGNAGGVHNLVIEPGKLDLAGLLAAMGTGLLVTELMGQGVNLVTGDYSRGAAGFWVENGVIQFPVEEITIAGNLRDMYANLVAVGNDVDTRGNTRTGSLLIANMTLAGN